MKGFNNIRISALLTALLLLFAAGPSAYAQQRIKPVAKISKPLAVQGDTALLTVEFSGKISNGYQLVDTAFQAITEHQPELEIVASGQISQTDLQDGQRVLRQLYTVQAFDSGLYSIPPIALIDGNDTILTETLALKVEPVELDSSLVVFNDKGEATDLTIHDMTDVEDVRRPFADYVPDWILSWGWWVLIAVVLIAAGLFVYYKWLRHGRLPLMPAKKKIPPYELAMSQLATLKEEKLWQKGSEEEYYTRLTDIIREYLVGRFGISAREMTSHQILAALKHCPEALTDMDSMKELLQQADFVKFAKARPDAHDNERAFSDAQNFVESTRPVEQPEEEGKNESNGEADTDKATAGKAESPSDKTNETKPN